MAPIKRVRSSSRGRKAEAATDKASNSHHNGSKAEPKADRGVFSNLTPNVGVFLVMYVLATTAVPVYVHYQVHHKLCATQALLSFFLGLNVLICLWEVGLGMHIGHIETEHTRLRGIYGDAPWSAVVDFFLTPCPLDCLLSSKFWTRVWATYSLYDPSYSNRQSYGFFVDVSNGWASLLPSLLFWAAMTVDLPTPLGGGLVSARAIGCMGLVKFYVEMHGTCVYFLSFLLNERYKGRGLVEVLLFVGLSNGLWLVFPLLGIQASLSMIFQNSFAVFGR